jgi:hypothetical protein
MLMGDRLGEGPATKILVGSDKTPFHVQTSLLKEWSPYFRRLLLVKSEPEHEPFQITVPVPKEIFGVFTHWLYRNEVPTDVTLQTVASTYFCAERLEIPRLKNALINKIIDCINDETTTAFFTTDHIRCAFTDLPAGSKFRKLLVDCYTWRVFFPDTEESRDLFRKSPEFAVALAIGLSGKSLHPGLPSPLTAANRCSYHDHTADERAVRSRICPDERNPR